MKCPCCDKLINFRAGDRFVIGVDDVERYILAQISTDTVTLIGLRDGNRWSDNPVRVENILEIDPWVISALADGETWQFVERGNPIDYDFQSYNDDEEDEALS